VGFWCWNDAFWCIYTRDTVTDFSVPLSRKSFWRVNPRNPAWPDNVDDVVTHMIPSSTDCIAARTTLLVTWSDLQGSFSYQKHFQVPCRHSLPVLTLSVGVGDVRVRLFVCLFVLSITKERMVPNVLNLVYGMTLDILDMTWIVCWKVKSQGHRVNNCIFHTNARG